MKRKTKQMEIITLTFLASIFLGMVYLILDGRKKNKKK